MLSSLCLEYHSGVLFGYYDCNTQRIQRMAIELVVVTFGTFHEATCHGDTTQQQRGRKLQTCEGRGMVCPLEKHI